MKLTIQELRQVIKEALDANAVDDLSLFIAGDHDSSDQAWNVLANALRRDHGYSVHPRPQDGSPVKQLVVWKGRSGSGLGNDVYDTSFVPVQPDDTFDVLKDRCANALDKKIGKGRAKQSRFDKLRAMR